MQYANMTLEEYLTSEQMTDAAFAEMIDRDPATISRLRRGITFPDWQTLARIRDVTGGAVTPNDFLPDIKPKSKRSAA